MPAQKWEYLHRSMFDFVQEGDGIAGNAHWQARALGALNAFGQDGWELVSVGGSEGSPEFFIFKRPLED